MTKALGVKQPQVSRFAGRPRGKLNAVIHPASARLAAVTATA